jgi:hypothetical protein
LCTHFHIHERGRAGDRESRPAGQAGPGGKVELTERWELIKGMDDFKDGAGIDENVLPQGKRK